MSAVCAGESGALGIEAGTALRIVLMGLWCSWCPSRVRKSIRYFGIFPSRADVRYWDIEQQPWWKKCPTVSKRELPQVHLCSSASAPGDRQGEVEVLNCSAQP